MSTQMDGGPLNETNQIKNEPAKRFDAGKSRPDLIPPEFLNELGILMAEGAKKYGERNWEKGMSWSRCLGPLMRHYVKWCLGWLKDDETRVHHMVCVAWNAMAIYIYETRGMHAFDDTGRKVQGHKDPKPIVVAQGNLGKQLRPVTCCFNCTKFGREENNCLKLPGFIEHIEKPKEVSCTDFAMRRAAGEILHAEPV